MNCFINFKKLLPISNPFICLILKREFSSMDEAHNTLLNCCEELLPVLRQNTHKGDMGRIGVFGGSVEFTGAPYYAGISALKTGADLTYVFSDSSAAPVIKSYSPELMVLPYLDSEDAVELITPWLSRLHAILIGPGLGRSDKIFTAIRNIISVLKLSPGEGGIFKPLVLDADALFFLSKNTDVLKDYPGDVYLTPNVAEFKNLLRALLHIETFESNSTEFYLKSLCKEVGNNVIVVLKGKVDTICNKEKILLCKAEGSSRRCGGQGDMLSGVLCTFASWVTNRRLNNFPHIANRYNDNILAGYSACTITRSCNNAAFKIKGRSMLTTDMISEFSSVFFLLFKGN